MGQGRPHSTLFDQADQDAILEQILAALQRRRDQRRTGELPRTLSAMAIARRFRVREGGSRDSRRRGVRLLIKQLRDQGHAVLSKGDGYYLGTEAADFAEAEQFARRSGLGELTRAAAIRRSPDRADAAGQLRLGADTGCGQTIPDRRSEGAH